MKVSAAKCAVELSHKQCVSALGIRFFCVFLIPNPIYSSRAEGVTLLQSVEASQRMLRAQC